QHDSPPIAPSHGPSVRRVAAAEKARLSRRIASRIESARERLLEHDARAPRAGVIVDLLGLPAERLVKAHRALVAEGGDRLHRGAARLAAPLFEGFVEQAAHVLAPVLRIDADQ